MAHTPVCVSAAPRTCQPRGTARPTPRQRLKKGLHLHCIGFMFARSWQRHQSVRRCREFAVCIYSGFSALGAGEE